MKLLQTVVLVCLLLVTSTITLAQEDEPPAPPPLTAAQIAEFVPVDFYLQPDYAASNGELAVIRRNASAANNDYDGIVIEIASGAERLNLGRTRTVEFVGDDQLLWIGAYDTQSARVYQVPDLTEVGRFPLGIFPVPRLYGEGYLYTTNNAAFYQPADLQVEPVLIAANLNYSPAYSGAISEFADGSRVAVAGQNGIVIVDIETGEIQQRLDYPLGVQMRILEDGTRLSAITNFDAYSGGASSWLVYDLVEDRALIEVYGGGGSHGVLSADGRFAAGSIRVNNAGVGRLDIYDVATGESLLTVDDAAHGFFGTPYYAFWGDSLVFLREWNGSSGLISVFDAAANQLYDTEYQAIYAPLRLNEALVQVWLSNDNQLNRFGVFEVETQTMVQEYPAFVVEQAAEQTLIGGGLVYGLPTEDRPALLILNGRVSGVNVRAEPSPNGAWLGSAADRVAAVGRNEANTWVYLSSHAGWVSVDVVRWDDDTADLAVIGE